MEFSKSNGVRNHSRSQTYIYLSTLELVFKRMLAVSMLVDIANPSKDDNPEAFMQLKNGVTVGCVILL